MQIEDDPGRASESYSFLTRHLAPINFALTHFYRLRAEQVTECRRNLSEWFRLFSEREGVEEMPLARFETLLVVVACRFARDIQLRKLKRRASLYPQVNRALARKPEEVAAEVLRMTWSCRTSGETR